MPEFPGANQEKTMGDRANVVIKSQLGQVALYTHYMGTELPETLRSSLIRGKSRWNDPQYLSRIIFCDMAKGDESGLTGLGISQIVGDGHDKILNIDGEKMTVSFNDYAPLTFAEYVSFPRSWPE